MARRVLPLLLAVLFAVPVPGSARAAAGERFTVQPRELPYQLATYPLVSGRYTLLSLQQPYDTYALFDDRTGAHTTITPPGGQACNLWANAFATPWLLFYCTSGAGPTLYNIQTRRWTALPCGQACENIGVAAPVGMGSDWVDVDEEEYCDPRMGPCGASFAFVALPSGRPGSYTPSPRTLLDLNSRSLSRSICAPWSQPATGSISLDGRFVVLQHSGGVGVARCGASSVRRLVIGGNTGLADTAHLVASCPTTTSPVGLSRSGPYNGVFLPSLRRFTLTLPRNFTPCSAYFDDGALYLSSEQTDGVWRAALPTGPLPTYPSCPGTDAVSLHSTNPDAYRQLVPNGANQILLCRYGPRNRPRLLGHRRVTSQTAVSSLIRALDRLPWSHRGGNCSAHTAPAITAFFRYPSADDVPVTINLNGCGTVSNGHLRHTPSARSAQTLLGRLRQLA